MILKLPLLSMCQLPSCNACLLSQGASSPSIHAHFQNKPRQVWAHCSMPLTWLTHPCTMTTGPLCLRHVLHWHFGKPNETSNIRNLDCALLAWNWSKLLLRSKETPSNIRHGDANGVAKVTLNLTWRDLFDVQLKEENWNLKCHRWLS